jgi:predicted polyphosphate/ATP-dependent NAD kinase
MIDGCCAPPAAGSSRERGAGADVSASRAARRPLAAGAVQVVVTPGSGEGRARTTARRLATRLERGGRVVDVRVFADLAALAAWAETCPPGASHLVCIGGDATLSAAAAAAIRGDVPFVPVPNGFGNVFAPGGRGGAAPRRG